MFGPECPKMSQNVPARKKSDAGAALTSLRFDYLLGTPPPARYLPGPRPGVTPMRFHFSLLTLLVFAVTSRADDLPIVSDVEGQPLGQNAARLLQALDLLGSPLSKDVTDKLLA